MGIEKRGGSGNISHHPVWLEGSRLHWGSLELSALLALACAVCIYDCIRLCQRENRSVFETPWVLLLK